MAKIRFTLNQLREKYRLHKYNAKRRGKGGRGVPFLLTFDEWLKIWIDSGHINEMGRRRDQYCMARNGDKGPYKVGNVKIITAHENCTDKEILSGKDHPFYGRRHTEKAKAEVRRKMLGDNNPFYGRHHSEESRAQMGRSRYGKDNPFYGRKHFEETKAEMRRLALLREVRSGKDAGFYGRKHSEETRLQMRRSRLKFLRKKKQQLEIQ